VSEEQFNLIVTATKLKPSSSAFESGLDPLATLVVHRMRLVASILHSRGLSIYSEPPPVYGRQGSATEHDSASHSLLILC
jgi:hypothetical protein